MMKKRKILPLIVLIALAASVLCGCRITGALETESAVAETESEREQEREGAVATAKPDDKAAFQVNVGTKNNEDSDNSDGRETSLQGESIGKAGYISFMEKLDPETAYMDELFYGEIESTDGIVIIAAFGEASGDQGGFDFIRASFVLQDKNGKTELIARDFCNDSGYEAFNIGFERFAGSNRVYIVVGLTNTVNMNGIAIYGMEKGELKYLCGSASPTGVGNAYLSDMREDGSYGGFTAELFSYDVLYYPVTVFYRFTEGIFLQEEAVVDVGNYPETPEDVVISYLSLECLGQMYYSSEIADRRREMTNGGQQYYFISEGWHEALHYVVLRIEPFDGPAVTVSSEADGPNAEVTVNFSDPENRKTVTILFNLIMDNGKWFIADANETVTMESGTGGFVFKTYSVIRNIYGEAGETGGYAELDLVLPVLEGTYNGIQKINGYFTGRERFFTDEYPTECLLPAEETNGVVIGGKKDGFFRSAEYRLELKAGDMVSISGWLNGGAGGVNWAGLEGHTFDLNTGVKIKLSDIFKADESVYTNRILDFVTEKIAKEIENTPDYSPFFFEDAYSGEAREMIANYDLEDFYLTNGSLVVFYQKYDLAPGASGLQIFEIPYDLFADILAVKIPA